MGPNVTTLDGSVACGAMTLDNILNLTASGLASHTQLNASGRISLNQTKHHTGMMASTATVTNAVSCGSLSTSEINLSVPGLSSNITINGQGRLSFTQLNTRILGDIQVIGNLSVRGTAGGGTVDLSDY